MSAAPHWVQLAMSPVSHEDGSQVQSPRGRLGSGVAVQRKDTEVGGEGLETHLAHLENEVVGARLAFRTIVERSSNALLLHRDGRVVQVNTACAALLGYPSAGDLLGRDMTSLVHPFDLVAMQERLLATHPVGAPAPVVSMRLVRRDGKELAVQASATALLVDGIPSVLIAASDLTEPRIDVKALQADRMTALGTLAAGVAHEVNNPLGFTVANVAFALEELSRMETELMPTEDEPNGTTEARLAGVRLRMPPVLEALQEARQGSERVRLVVRDLKMFGGRDAARAVDVDVRRVIESSINMAYSAIRHRARLVKDYRAAPTVAGNEGRLAQVFLNLLVNAAEAIREGDPEREEIRVVLAADPAGWCVVEVSDTGRGIAPEHLAGVFDPFFSTKPGSGTGLGLSICQAVVVGMGGDIAVESRLAKGTTFRVTLPIAKDETPPSRGKRPSIRLTRRARVLVIDDEPMMARAVQRMLASEHDVEAMTDPMSAVERLRGGARYDVILCDLMMPMMSGMDVYDAILAIDEGQAQAMVFMTGGAYTPRAAEFLESVGNPHLEKPLDRAALHAVLRGQISP
jgi:PAS domain S-box-containing protein